MTQPLLLVILDGWGHRAETESNAIAANAPYFHDLLGRYPHALLSTCGREVGLPTGVMGNSEVGHLNLGAGRVVNQDVTRINAAIEDGSFAQCGAFVQLIDRLVREGKPLHLLGLVSDAGVHASDLHLRHLLLLAAARGMPADAVFVHAITDGRDTPPRSGPEHLARVEADLAAAGVGRIASVVGRYWCMDRDKRWERVERAYDLLVQGIGACANNAAQAISDSHAADVGDEFVEPVVIGPPDQGRIEDGSGLIVFNYRSDRVREICDALHAEAFEGFERKRRVQPEIVTMTRYREDFPFAVGFPPVSLEGLFPELVSQAGLRQKRIAETEKYAHVTFFFSGGEEAPYPGEERILIPSPKVATYDLQPEMSAQGVTDAICKSLAEDETDVYIINFANADMVGHTGDFDAASAAVGKVDACLKTIVEEVRKRGGTTVITADHGNSEQLWDPTTGQPHTAHTLNPVPVVFCGDALVGSQIRERGVLADVAPTLLGLMGMDLSAGMDGKSLLG
ncbi:MAG: phosphoglycerate mutase (2,3-diphosphoglycerate-independent) [Planctomycetes bacterium]|jgi:2,3-bisphosphoglycerate-independent phosphoglycerate mutase|nr:phosphoglycerate mutase (2,3-diphosphoglycerate-independent) [Planctomycetota bacterium]MBV21079.1 phosphoglycerate mutase (2,3-diphosphoglycerate-independent) [Planctomycetaceae bacterium]HJM57374.1 2,3-bisphosphoglycerate-independent phosphoglycerate mutase [Planctomycetota bacterium]